MSDGACPKCQAPMEASESFCAACGAQVRRSEEQNRQLKSRWRGAVEKSRFGQEVSKGRGWILAVSILTLIGGLVFFGLERSRVEKDIREAEAEFAGMDSKERDAAIKAETGMTWQELVDRDRGNVMFNLVTNLALTVIYFGLWLWAKRNAFAAALTALIFFITVMLIHAVVDPTTIVKGILIKILVIVGLIGAISAAYKQRRLYGRAA